MASEVVNELEEVEVRHLRKLPKLKNEFRYVLYFIVRGVCSVVMYVRGVCVLLIGVNNLVVLCFWWLVCVVFWGCGGLVYNILRHRNVIIWLFIIVCVILTKLSITSLLLNIAYLHTILRTAYASFIKTVYTLY